MYRIWRLICNEGQIGGPFDRWTPQDRHQPTLQVGHSAESDGGIVTKLTQVAIRIFCPGWLDPIIETSLDMSAGEESARHIRAKRKQGPRQTRFELHLDRLNPLNVYESINSLQKHHSMTTHIQTYTSTDCIYTQVQIVPSLRALAVGLMPSTLNLNENVHTNHIKHKRAATNSFSLPKVLKAIGMFVKCSRGEPEIGLGLDNSCLYSSSPKIRREVMSGVQHQKSGVVIPNQHSTPSQSLKVNSFVHTCPLFFVKSGYTNTLPTYTCSLTSIGGAWSTDPLEASKLWLVNKFKT